LAIPAPEDKTYHIWVIENDVSKPGGLFETRGEWVATSVETPWTGPTP
jgi:hypothetical protein